MLLLRASRVGRSYSWLAFIDSNPLPLSLISGDGQILLLYPSYELDILGASNLISSSSYFSPFNKDFCCSFASIESRSTFVKTPFMNVPTILPGFFLLSRVLNRLVPFSPCACFCTSSPRSPQLIAMSRSTEISFPLIMVLTNLGISVFNESILRLFYSNLFLKMS